MLAYEYICRYIVCIYIYTCIHIYTVMYVYMYTLPSIQQLSDMST